MILIFFKNYDSTFYHDNDPNFPTPLSWALKKFIPFWHICSFINSWMQQLTNTWLWSADTVYIHIYINAHEFKPNHAGLISNRTQWELRWRRRAQIKRLTSWSRGSSWKTRSWWWPAPHPAWAESSAWIWLKPAAES